MYEINPHQLTPLEAQLTMVSSVEMTSLQIMGGGEGGIVH